MQQTGGGGLFWPYITHRAVSFGRTHCVRLRLLALHSIRIRGREHATAR